MKNRLNKLATALFLSTLLAGCGLGTESTPIGGTVSGLTSGTNVVLVDNGTDSLNVGANGSFSFATQLQAGGAYSVTVGTQPAGQNCGVVNATGTVDQADDPVTNITVTCQTSTTTNEIFGTVSGLLSGNSVTLLATGSTTQTQIVSSNGVFVFSTPQLVGTTYTVSVATEPTGQTCTVPSGTGTVPATGQTSVIVTCQ